MGHIAEWAPSAALAVPVGDASALAKAICTVLADEELRLCLARAAQCRALSEDADFTARRFEGLYRHVKMARDRSANGKLVRGFARRTAARHKPKPP